MVMRFTARGVGRVGEEGAGENAAELLVRTRPSPVTEAALALSGDTMAGQAHHRSRLRHFRAVEVGLPRRAGWDKAVPRGPLHRCVIRTRDGPVVALMEDSCGR